MEVGNKARVLVLMATYNGERFVSGQIDSVLAQEGVDVEVVVNDDCSTDRTYEIVERYARKDTRVRCSRNERNIGYTRNFMEMVREADASAYDYFAFSDQDDYWLPEKLFKAVEALSNVEGPSLYYSDVTNTDINLNYGESEYKPFLGCTSKLKTLLLINWASGCTMVFNSQLCHLLQSRIPDSFPRVHDVWVHLVAMSCGAIVCDLEHSYILRRISGSNAIGIKGLGKFGPKRIMRGMIKFIQPADHINTRTASLLLDCFGPYMDGDSKEVIEAFLSMSDSLGSRIRVALDPGYSTPYFLETIIIKFKIVFNRF